MHLQTEPIQTAPAPSATVIMVRDSDAGLEVFLLQRHGLSDVLGGAYVFPGGKVDAADADELTALDVDLQAMHEALGEPELSLEQAGALYAAAARELQEEAGVILPASALVPWSRWITPIVGGVVRKRFDARFFIAHADAAQEARHDDHETVESGWLRPADALAQYWAHAIELAPPQIMTLQHLARFASAHDAVEHARSRKPPLILPESWQEAEGRAVCYPGDERHPVRERAMPGPTRLVWRNKRFEPEGGLEALLA
jgi:8-oxo-dGTP pyrophosphatase MutT (NUDIX family)